MILNRMLGLAAASLCLLSGCESMDPHRNDPRLSVTFHEFDRADGRSWRALVKQRRFDEAAELIEAYLQRQPELTRDQDAVLRFHLGELLAIQGKNREAVSELRRAYASAGSTLPPNWNMYIDGIISFLNRDRETLATIAEQFANSERKDYHAAVEALRQNFDASYESIVFPK